MGFLNRRCCDSNIIDFGFLMMFFYYRVVLNCDFHTRFGVPLIDGGTVRLSKLIGLSRAMDLILTGRMLDPKVILLLLTQASFLLHFAREKDFQESLN